MLQLIIIVLCIIVLIKPDLSIKKEYRGRGTEQQVDALCKNIRINYLIYLIAFSISEIHYIDTYNDTLKILSYVVALGVLIFAIISMIKRNDVIKSIYAAIDMGSSYAGEPNGMAPNFSQNQGFGQPMQNQGYGQPMQNQGFGQQNQQYGQPYNQQGMNQGFNQQQGQQFGQPYNQSGMNQNFGQPQQNQNFGQAQGNQNFGQQTNQNGSGFGQGQ